MSGSVDGAPKAQGLAGAVAVGAMAAIISAVGSLIRSKSSALALGPAGVGLIAEVQQLLALVQVPVSTLVGAGLTKTLVEANAVGSEAMRRRVRDATTAVLLVAGAMAVLGVPLAALVLDGEGDVASLTQTVALAGVGAVATACLSVYAQSLTIWRRFTSSAAVTSTSVFISAIASALLVFLVGVDGVFIGLIVGPAVAFPIAMQQMRRWGGAGSWLPSGRVEFAPLVTSIRIGGAALVGSLVTQSALSVLRWALIDSGGRETHGLFQSAWALDMLFTGLLTTGLSSYFFPRFAATKSTEELQTEVVAAARFMLLVGTPAVVLFAATRHVLLLVAYSERFSDASVVVGLFAVGDALKLIGWVSAAPLLYLGRARAFMLTEGLAAGTLALVGVVLVPRLGLVGGGLAQVCMYFVYLVVTRVVLARTLRVTVPLRLPLAFVGVAAALAAFVFITERSPWLSSIGVLIAGLMAVRAGAWTFARRWLKARLETPRES